MDFDREKLSGTLRAAAAEERAAQAGARNLDRVAPVPVDASTGEPIIPPDVILSYDDWHLARKNAGAVYDAAMGNEEVRQR
jgi:hypothetical protein